MKIYNLFTFFLFMLLLNKSHFMASLFSRIFYLNTYTYTYVRLLISNVALVLLYLVWFRS